MFAASDWLEDMVTADHLVRCLTAWCRGSCSSIIWHWWSLLHSVCWEWVWEITGLPWSVVRSLRWWAAMKLKSTALFHQQHWNPRWKAIMQSNSRFSYLSKNLQQEPQKNKCITKLNMKSTVMEPKFDDSTAKKCGVILWSCNHGDYEGQLMRMRELVAQIPSIQQKQCNYRVLGWSL